MQVRRDQDPASEEEDSDEEHRSRDFAQRSESGPIVLSTLIQEVSVWPLRLSCLFYNMEPENRAGFCTRTEGDTWNLVELGKASTELVAKPTVSWRKNKGNGLR